MFSFHRECMGTIFHFQIEDQISDVELNRLCSGAMEVLDDADDRFSLYKPESELSRLVSGRLEWEKASPQQLTIRRLASDWQSVTEGYFNARAGSEYDPSGIVKTWAAQNVINFLLGNGVRAFTLNSGGDIYLSDELESEILNRVGISKLVSIAEKGAGAALVLDLKDKPYRAVCTSGSVERGEHIWSIGTETPFVQASVIGPDLLEADVWATALIAGGYEAWELFKTKAPKLHGIVFSKSGEMLTSPEFEESQLTLK